MRKRMGVLLGALVIASSLFFTIKNSSAVVVPGGPPVQGSAIQGNCTDGQILRGSTYYGGSCAAVNSGWLQENATGVGIASSINGAITPKSSLDVSGGVSVGTYAGSNAAPTNGAIISGVVGVGTASPSSNVQLTIAPLNASTTGQIVNTPASPTADIQEWQLNGTTVARVSANGGFAPHIYIKAQIDTLVPDMLGEVILCSNCFSPYALCVATGTSASQWEVAGASGTTRSQGVGCGSNN